VELIQDTNASGAETNATAGTCTIKVTNGNFTIQPIAFAATDTQVIAKGVCVETSPKIQVSPASLDFGSIECPGSSATRTVTISNTAANTTLIINSIEIAGANPGDFIQTNNCSTVAGNSSCTATIMFAPASVGSKIAELVVVSNDLADPAVTVPMIGQGIDTIAPVLNVSISPAMLWPPNHKMVTVTPSISVADANPGTTVSLVSASSSEPDNGSGDGDTDSDIVVNADGTLSLRAERSAKGSGRVYTVTYQATDIAGNTTTASATVTVPHDKR
jgi:hypothetical protein